MCVTALYDARPHSQALRRVRTDVSTPGNISGNSLPRRPRITSSGSLRDPKERRHVMDFLGGLLGGILGGGGGGGGLLGGLLGGGEGGGLLGGLLGKGGILGGLFGGGEG